MKEPCLSISIPTAVFPYVRDSIKELQVEMLLFLAIKCYQRSLLSIGKAAELAGMSRVNFEIYLSENKIPVSNLDYSDISEDLKKMNV
jgi:predicted HTH domain antitoxin